MNSSTSMQIDSRNLLRLSTVLYIDSTTGYQFNQETMITKTIESIFIGNNNFELSAEDISTIIKEDYKMNFEEEVIISLILKTKTFNSAHLLKYSDDEKKYILFNLDNNYFKELCKKAKPNYLDMTIKQLYNDNKDDYFFKGHTVKSIESIIYRFLYYLFAKNFSNFSYLLSKRKAFDNDFLKDISCTLVKDFTREDEVFIINSFLEYDDPYKNRIIFDIATLAFEYCTAIGAVDENLIKDIEYLNKKFFLDTNILYRILGINGIDRMNKTRTFIKKCKESGQILFIADATIKEFKESINHNCSYLNMYSPNANPEIYGIFGDVEMTKHYFNLKKKSNISPQQYKSMIFKNFDKFIKENDVTIIQTIELNTEDNKAIVTGLMSNLIEFTKNSENPKSKTRSYHDVWIYYYLYMQNSNNVKINNDYKYKLITTDDQLINWEKHLYYTYKNICIKPSDWLSFLFRYISTTDDDFESFVSFLKLNYHRESLFNEETIALIMNETAKYDLSYDEQKDMINNSLFNSYDRIKELQDSNNLESIKEVIEDSAISYLKEKYNNENLKLNEKISNHLKEKDKFEEEKNNLIKQNSKYKSEVEKSENSIALLKKDTIVTTAKNLEAKKDSLLKDLIIKWLIILLISLFIAIAPKKILIQYLNYELPQTVLTTGVTWIILEFLSSLLSKFNSLKIPSYKGYRAAKIEYTEYIRNNNL